MISRAILFQGAMVRALLDRTKKQTRRVCKPAANLSEVVGIQDPSEPGQRPLHIPGSGWFGDAEGDVQFFCPYGKRGDQLWVRETFFAFGRWETRFSPKKKRDEWHFVDMTLECGRQYQYAADQPTQLHFGGRGNSGATPMWWKRPAIFMPRAACRITLEITDVRVERLQNIRKADAISEGIERDVQPGDPAPLWRNYKTGNTTISPVYSYETLWESINGAESWAANPFVWIVEF